MKKQIITSEQAPPAVGPYSHAVTAGPFVFISGQIPLNRQVMENLKAILTTAGLGFSDVVKTTVFLKDMADFAEMNRVYGEFFPDNPPARSTLQVAGLARNAAVEIEAIAWKKD